MCDESHPGPPKMTAKSDLEWKLSNMIKEARNSLSIEQIVEITDIKEKYDELKQNVENAKTSHIIKNFNIDNMLDTIYEMCERMNEWAWDDFSSKEKIENINKVIRKLKVVRMLYKGRDY